MFYGVVSSRNCMIGSGIIVMGVTVVVLPFTTPETTALFGNKKARYMMKHGDMHTGVGAG